MNRRTSHIPRQSRFVKDIASGIIEIVVGLSCVGKGQPTTSVVWG
jgi:hypothetical protein